MARVSEEISGGGATGSALAAGSYDAFISYSQRGDKAIAEALRSVIQTIGKPWWKVRSLKVFLDAASLSAAPGLWESIAGKLDRSRYLILLASPEAARSPWVDREVAYFLATRGTGAVLIGLTDGELAWDGATGDFAWTEATPLPPSVRGRFPEEPLWVDLRAFRAEPARATKSDQAFLHAALDLAATIKGVEKADLYSAELRQQRRNLRVAYAAAGVVTALGVGAAAGAWIAVERAREATRNFAIARETVDNVVKGIVHDLRDVQGMRVESVQKILTTTQGALDRLFEIAPNDPAVRTSRAATLIEIGDTYVAKGDNIGALRAYDESLAIRRELSKGSDDRERTASVSQSLSRVGYALLNKGDLAGAGAAFDESLAILSGITATDPAEPDWQDRLAWDLMKKGEVLAAQGKATDAVALMERSAGIWRKGLAAHPSWRRTLAEVLDDIADAQEVLADQAAAIGALEEALALRRAISTDDRNDAAAEYSIARTLLQLAELRTASGDDAGTRSALVEADSILRRLVRIDAANVNWNGSLATTLVYRGILERASGNPQRAWDAFTEAEAIYRRLADLDPGRLGWRQSLSGVLYRLGYIKLAAGGGKEAVADFEESVKLRRTIAGETGNAARVALASALIALGDAHFEVDGPPAARASYAEAVALYRALVTEEPANRDWLDHLADGLTGIGRVELDAKDFTKATSAFEETLALRQQLVDLGPANIEWADMLAAAHAYLGDVSRAKGDYEDALRRYEESLVIRRDIVARAPEKEYLRANLAFNLEKVAERKLGLGDREGAIAAYRESITIREKFTDDANVRRIVDLARARWNLQRLVTDLEERLTLLTEEVDGLATLEEADRLTPEAGSLLEEARAEVKTVLAAMPKRPDEESPAEVSAGDGDRVSGRGD